MFGRDFANFFSDVAPTNFFNLFIIFFFLLVVFFVSKVSEKLRYSFPVVFLLPLFRQVELGSHRSVNGVRE
jgi:hypothetical protein